MLTSTVRFESKDSISNPRRTHIPPLSPEKEKVLKWREAFLAQFQEGDNKDLEPHLSKGKMPERQYIPRVNPPTLIPSTSNDFDDYFNWPDDISSDEHSNDDQLYHKTEEYSRLDRAEFTPVLGREILEPEQFNSHVGISEIHPDPTLKAFMHEEASKYQGMLRAQRIKAYQDASAFKPLFIDPPRPQSAPIGIIYLASSQNVDDPMHRGQLNIGIYVAPKYMEEPGVVQAVKEVVNEAFHDSNCHRLQAIVVDHMTKIDTLELYTARCAPRIISVLKKDILPIQRLCALVTTVVSLVRVLVVGGSSAPSHTNGRMCFTLPYWPPTGYLTITTLALVPKLSGRTSSFATREKGRSY